MKYLTFDEYKENGGTVSESAFPLLCKKAEKKLDVYTYNRLVDAETIPEEVKDVILLLIEELSKAEAGERIKSFSNGKVNFTFADEKTLDEIVEQIIVENLPFYLVSGVIGCE
jgi:hypothetical protein